MDVFNEWGFNPKFLPDQQVWWVTTVIRTGKIGGITFERVHVKNFNVDKGEIEDISTHNIVYLITESSGSVSREISVEENLLFRSRIDLIQFLESH